MNKMKKLALVSILLIAFLVCIYFFAIKPKEVAEAGLITSVEGVANGQTDFLMLDASSLPEKACYWITSRYEFEANEWFLEVSTYTNAENCTYGTLANTTTMKLDTPVSVTGKQCICQKSSVIPIGQLVSIMTNERNVQGITVRGIDIK